MRRASVRPVVVLLVAAATTFCGDSSSPNLATTGPITKFVVDQVTFPTAAGQYAFDMTGDGSADNQLGAVLRAFEQAGMDLQGLEDSAIASGDIVHLIALQADDTTLATDAVAGVTVNAGNAAAGPPGAGPYTVNNSVPAATFVGSLATYGVASRNPATATTPVALALELNLFGVLVALPMNGVRIAFTVVPGASPSLINGQINGSIRETDIQNLVEPSLQQGLNAIVTADPTTPTAQTILSLFDTGGCGSAAVDSLIELCEVTTNSLISTLLAPDVEIYNGSGGYHPNPANTNPNALSFGFGFTAIKTTY